MNTLPAPEASFLKDVVLLVAGAVVGAVIGFLSAEAHGYIQRKRDAKEKADDERCSYKAWLNGLRAELNHIQTVITEITGIIDGGHGSTKRINSDFLQEARLVIFKHDEDTVFLEQLTTAFRDIVHTNGMLDRVEATPARPLNVLASMKGVADSIKILSDTLNDKLNSL